MDTNANGDVGNMEDGMGMGVSRERRRCTS